MPDKTPIEWTDATWNPIRGCSIRIGKAKAGRVLDGVEHNGFPS
jgi:protein gp37